MVVKVSYAGVNGGCETFRVRGEHAFSGNQGLYDFPLGAECCGVVVAVGERVRQLEVGQAVAVNGAAGFSEYVVARPQLCIPVQEPTAAVVALVLSGVTACVALDVAARVKAGETVLVTAAAGGTGHLAVQLARLAGCHVIAICGGENKAQVVQNMGAERTINYQMEDVAEVLRREYPQGIDVMYDGVGGQLRDLLLSHLAPSGRLLQVGYISEYPHNTKVQTGSPSATADAAPTSSVDSSRLFWEGVDLDLGTKRIIGNIWPKDLLSIRRCRQKVFSLYTQGRLQVVVDTTREFKGLTCVPAAVNYMLSGQSIGKVVVQIDLG